MREAPRPTGAGASSSVPAGTTTGAPPSATATRSSRPSVDEAVDDRTDPRDASPQPPVLDHSRVSSALHARGRPSGPALAVARALPGPAPRARYEAAPGRAGRRAAGSPGARRSRGRRGSIDGRASPSPASSSTCPPRSTPRSAETGARRERGSRPGSRRRGEGASPRRRRTSGDRRLASGRRTAASPPPAAGKPRGPSIRTPALRRAVGRRFPRRYAPTRDDERDPVASLDRRDRVELDARERRIVSSTSRAEPTRDREAYPWAPITSRRSAVREIVCIRRIQPQRGTFSPWTSRQLRKKRDRELIELLNELRVALPGVQVLFAFLLIAPFSSKFEVDRVQKGAYLVALFSAVLGTILLIAPSAYHRLRWREKNKERMLQTSNRFAIAGLGAIAVAMSASIFLVTDVLLTRAAAALLTGAAGSVLRASPGSRCRSRPRMTAGTTTTTATSTTSRSRKRISCYAGVRPSRIVARRPGSMLPPETMHTIRPRLPGRRAQRRRRARPRLPRRPAPARRAGGPPRRSRRARGRTHLRATDAHAPTSAPADACFLLRPRTTVSSRPPPARLLRAMPTAAPPSRARTRAPWSRAQRSQCARDARGEPAAAPGDEHRVDLLELLDELEPDRAVPCHHAVVHHRVDEMPLDARDTSLLPSPATSGRTAP